MAKFSVCRIYKVTLWLNFSYNYSVNLLQILHLYIYDTPVLGSSRFALGRALGLKSRNGGGGALRHFDSCSRPFAHIFLVCSVRTQLTQRHLRII